MLGLEHNISVGNYQSTNNAPIRLGVEHCWLFLLDGGEEIGDSSIIGTARCRRRRRTGWGWRCGRNWLLLGLGGYQRLGISSVVCGQTHFYHFFLSSHFGLPHLCWSYTQSGSARNFHHLDILVEHRLGKQELITCKPRKKSEMFILTCLRLGMGTFSRF